MESAEKSIISELRKRFRVDNFNSKIVSFVKFRNENLQYCNK